MNAIAIHKDTRCRRYKILAGALIAIALGISSPLAGHAEPPSLTQGSAHHWYQIGKASWYGRLFQGHKTANGEPFNMNELTCAHRSLPMGSLVRVTNLRNRRSVVVRVNDRGPLPSNRVIDLSYAAAHFLDFSGKGTERVRLELIKDDPELANIVFPLTLFPTLTR